MELTLTIPEQVIDMKKGLPQIIVDQSGDNVVIDGEF